MIERKEYEKSELLAKIDFEGGKHVKAASCHIKSHPIHIHDCVEILYVIKGALHVKISNEAYLLEEGNFIVINDGEVHSVEDSTSGETQNVIGVIHFDIGLFQLTDGFFIWNVELLKLNQETYAKIINRIVAILKLSLQGFHVNYPQIVENVRAIIVLLKSEYMMESYNFASKEKNSYVNSTVNTERLHSLIAYLYSHCGEKLTLADTAQHFSVSKYYLSHFTKQAFGVSFQNLLHAIRIERSEIHLLGTELPIGEVSYESGFSSYQYFNRNFKEFYGMKPMEYRTVYRKETLKYKPMQEAPVKWTDAELLAILEGKKAKKKKNCITINLDDADFLVREFFEYGGETKTSTRLKVKGEPLVIDGDAEEMILIIKKQKTQ